MTKLSSISGYKNSLDRKKAKTMRRELIKDANHCAKGMGRVGGYCVIVWDKNSNSSVMWDTGSIMPVNVMPEYIKTAVMRTLGGVVEDA